MLLVITPGGADTRNLINAEVLKALGADGILINMARGSVVDEAALIRALQDKTILSAGLDVYAREPHVPAELIAMEHVVLFPHLGSASIATREGRMSWSLIISWPGRRASRRLLRWRRRPGRRPDANDYFCHARFWEYTKLSKLFSPTRNQRYCSSRNFSHGSRMRLKLALLAAISRYS